MDIDLETQNKEIENPKGLTDEVKQNLKENAIRTNVTMLNPPQEDKLNVKPFTEEEIILIRKNMPHNSLLSNLTNNEFRLWKEGKERLPKLPNQDDKSFIPKYNTEDFKLSNGEHDTYCEAKTQSFLRILGYCKLLQVLMSDWINIERTTVLTPKEAMIWWKVMRNSVFKLVEDYSILEMCEINTEDIEPIFDKDGKNTGKVRLKANVLNTHATKFPDGSIGIDPNQIAETNKELREQLEEMEKTKEENKKMNENHQIVRDKCNEEEKGEVLEEISIIS
tara:strand:- start:41 stop:877 length:837 start_codon:yes stop_codon:yes gene_type:complete